MDERYPIGKFEHKGNVTEAERMAWLKDIEELPEKLKLAVSGLSDEQLNTPYRKDGWTVKQVVHHLADSHMNSFIRFKLALTEENPIIKPYGEESWAELPDVIDAPIDLSLELLYSLHNRWAILVSAFEPADFNKTFYHPETKESIRLDSCLGLYAWHSRHHVAHITSLREKKGW